MVLLDDYTQVHTNIYMLVIKLVTPSDSFKFFPETTVHFRLSMLIAVVDA